MESNSGPLTNILQYSVFLSEAAKPLNKERICFVRTFQTIVSPVNSYTSKKCLLKCKTEYADWVLLTVFKSRASSCGSNNSSSPILLKDTDILPRTVWGWIEHITKSRPTSLTNPKASTLLYTKERAILYKLTYLLNSWYIFCIP